MAMLLALRSGTRVLQVDHAAAGEVEVVRVGDPGAAGRVGIGVDIGPADGRAQRAGRRHRSAVAGHQVRRLTLDRRRCRRARRRRARPVHAPPRADRPWERARPRSLALPASMAGTAGHQGHGLGRAPVILQRAEEGIDVE